MTTDLSERRAAYADALRRIADLTESGVLPLPISPTSLSFWFRENEGGREAAVVAAEALAVDWHAEAASSGNRKYLRTVASLRPAAPIDLSLYLETEQADDEPVPPPPSVAFAAELNAAAGASA